MTSRELFSNKDTMVKGGFTEVQICSLLFPPRETSHSQTCAPVASQGRIANGKGWYDTIDGYD